MITDDDMPVRVPHNPLTPHDPMSDDDVPVCVPRDPLLLALTPHQVGPGGGHAPQHRSLRKTTIVQEDEDNYYNYVRRFRKLITSED